LQCSPCRKAVAPVCVALQRREVVEQRCTLGLFLALDRLDGPVFSCDLLDDSLSTREISEEPCLVAFEPDARVAPVERRVDETIGLGDEGLDLALTLHDHRERRRLHASERDDAADPRTPANRGRPRRVHPDEPIGFTSRARRRFERVHLVARTELLESLAEPLLPHRRGPPPIDRLPPP